VEGEEDVLISLIMIGLVYGLPILLALGGLLVGAILEARHFASIRRREAAFAEYPAVPTRTWDSSRTVAETQLVSASVVVSLDYFKRILASFRNVFGGNVRSYETLLDRAKREAVLRLRERTPNGHIILNLRIVTSTIGATEGRQGLGAVEVLAFGTSVRYKEGDDPSRSRVSGTGGLKREAG